MRNKLEARDKVIVDEALIRQCIQLEDRFAEEIAATARDEGTTGGAWQESGAGSGGWAPPLWCLPSPCIVLPSRCCVGAAVPGRGRLGVSFVGFAPYIHKGKGNLKP